MPLTIDTRVGPLAYEERGTGFPVLLIHGAGGDRDMWRPVLDRFAGLRVIALDLPGHGGSGGTGHGRVEPYADAVEAFADALRLDRYAAVGHSLGGAIVQHLARTAPQRCAAIVISCSFPTLPADPARLRQIQETWEEYVSFNVPKQVSPEATEEQKAAADALVRKRQPQIFVDDLRACDAFDSISWLKEIGVPALIVAAYEDQLTPMSGALQLYEGIVGARLAILGPGGHWLMVEQPGLYVATVGGFLAETAGREVAPQI